MNHLSLAILKFIGRKLAILLLIAGSTVASFATLGDGKKKSDLPKSTLLSKKSTVKTGTFSLRSGYSYRGNKLFSPENETKYINVNSTVTLKRGNTTFIIPLKKKVILSKIKLDISNRQFQRN
jgi:hypothetical protein